MPATGFGAKLMAKRKKSSGPDLVTEDILLAEEDLAAMRPALAVAPELVVETITRARRLRRRQQGKKKAGRARKSPAKKARKASMTKAGKSPAKRKKTKTKRRK